MKVELLTYTPEPEKTIAAAARLCYSSKGVLELKDNLGEEETAQFLKELIERGHLSPLEHASFTFAIEGVSRALSHQMVRHRIASYSQKSQRYVNEQNFKYVIPLSIKKNKEAETLFIQQMEEIRQAYLKLSEVVPKEDARYVLPNACQTQFVATYNARSLLNFFSLRCCRRAQWEIRSLAWRMLHLVRKVAPGLFLYAGPNCKVFGVCYEGPFSCGRAEVVVKRGEKN